GSVVARQLADRAGEVPLYVGNTKFYGGGPAYLGPAFAPFMPRPNPLSSTGDNTYDPVPLYLTVGGRSDLGLSPDGALTLRRRRDQCPTGFPLRARPGRISPWDAHPIKAHFFTSYDEQMPSFDRAVSALIADRARRGLDRHVLFVICGEFGRTPRIEYQDASR